MGSMEMTRRPSAVISALKLAGPSPQPRIARPQSAADRLNISSYSSRERPHGTMLFNLTTNRSSVRRALLGVARGQDPRLVGQVDVHLSPFQFRDCLAR